MNCNWSGIVVRLERDIVVRFERDTPHVMKTSTASDLLGHRIIHKLEAWLEMWMWEKANEFPPRRCLACKYEFRDSNLPPAFVVMMMMMMSENEFEFPRAICASCAQKNDSELLAVGGKDVIKREEEFTRAQAQMEYLACLAHDVKIAVEALEDEFCGLADWPEHLGEMMPQLAAAANAVAKETCEWARDSNLDFDPSRPKGNRTAISEHEAAVAARKAAEMRDKFPRSLALLDECITGRHGLTEEQTRKKFINALKADDEQRDAVLNEFFLEIVSRELRSATAAALPPC